MAGMGRLTGAALVLMGAFLSASTANAGPIWDWLCGGCPPPAYYSPARYWAPEAARGYDCVCGPHMGVYPPYRRPEVPPTMDILKYPCPPAPAEATLIYVPTPPESSKFEYFQRTAGSTGGIGLSTEKKDNKVP
jgi:hypothetical protein